jgi:fructokinase
LEVAAALTAPPAHFEALHFGSLELMLEPLADAVSAVVEAAASRQALVVLDPNIRPSVIVDRAGYLARLHRLGATPPRMRL